MWTAVADSAVAVGAALPTWHTGRPRRHAADGRELRGVIQFAARLRATPRTPGRKTDLTNLRYVRPPDIYDPALLLLYPTSMRDLDTTRPRPAGQLAPAAAPSPGRSTLVEPPLPTGEHTARAATTPAPAPTPAAVPAAPTGDTLTVYSDDHHAAHAAPFEHAVKHRDNHYAPHSAQNRGGVHSDKTSATTAGGRPGVVVDHNSFFRLKDATAVRYTYSATGDTNVAQPFDLIKRADLAHYNYNDKGALSAKEKAAVAGKSQRLLLNPALPRELSINGKRHMCVLSWVDGKGAAWLPLSDLAGNTSAIHKEVTARAKRENPTSAAGPATRYVVRNDAVGQATAGDAPKGKEHVLGPHQKGGDNVSHYLEKDQRKPVIGDDGTATGKNAWVSFAALCMNLPEPAVAPVAVDTLRAGESFFVMNATKFHQQIAVYQNNSAKSHERMTWVFGNVGKLGARGAIERDPHRCGWVPLRILAQASQEHEKDVTKKA